MIVNTKTFGMKNHPEIDGKIGENFFAWLEGGKLISSPTFETGNTNH